MLTIVSEMARRKDEEARLEREHTFALLVAQGARKDEEARLERERKDEEARLERERAAALLREQEAAVWKERLEVMQHELDMARGTVRARPLYEACIHAIFTRALAAQPPDKAAAFATASSPSAKQGKLIEGTGCPALRAYLSMVAEDNSASPADVLSRARKMYGALSAPLHGEDKDASTVTLPHELFGDKANLLAFAAVVRFAGRDPGLYLRGGVRYPLVLRAPPQSCAATEGEVRAAALPASPTPVSVELLVEAEEADAGGAEA